MSNIMAATGEKTRIVKITIPEGMYEKICALIDSENSIKSTGPVSVSDWVAWAASYCLEKQTKAIRAFGRSTFTCDGCGNILRYTALNGVIQRNGLQRCLCGDCYRVHLDALPELPHEPKADPALIQPRSLDA